VFLILLFGIRAGQVTAADKTDVVVMMNGDRFVGEIKKLEFGELEFKASYMASSVDLDWTKVAEIQSARHFRVEFVDGILRLGVISKSTAGPNVDFAVANPDGTTARGSREVVAIHSVEGNFFTRLKGSADVGLTLRPQAGQTQYTANLTTEYPSERYRVFVQASSLFSSQEGADNTERDSLALAYYRYLSHNWFFSGMSQFLKDSELELDLRSTLSAGPGRFLIHTNRTGLAVFGGIAGTHENYSGASASRNGTNSEILAGTEFYTVRFARSQINTRLLVYSGINQWGRERVDWESSINWKFWKDVYWKMTALENFDSRPPTGAHRTDFTLTSTFGLTF